MLAPFTHEGSIARAIHLFKYEDRPELARPLARLVAERLGPLEPELSVAAIPLHESRFRERKYDQAHLLASELAQLWRLSYLPRALQRTRATRRQVGLDEAAREDNVANAFLGSKVKNLKILLVDDVFTTGATARAASEALRVAGALDVWVLAVGRAHSVG